MNDLGIEISFCKSRNEMEFIFTEDGMYYNLESSFYNFTLTL